MRLNRLQEVTWRFYQNGKALANNQSLLKTDIAQKVKLLLADLMRQRYYESKKNDEFLRPDYSFVSPLLEVKRFKLLDKKDHKFRRCDMKEFDMYRLPGNSHITNVYPVGNCGNDDLGEITQVSPGEENFYANDPDFSDIFFFVIKGSGLNAYNIPDCVSELDVEATYDGDDIEVESSMASVIMDQILNVSLGIKKQFYSEQAANEMAEQNVVK